MTQLLRVFSVYVKNLTYCHGPFLSSWSLFLTLLVMSCGPTSNPESDAKYRFLDSDFPGYSDFASPAAWTANSLVTKTLRPINVRVIGSHNYLTFADIHDMVIKWLNPLRRISSQVSNTVNISSAAINADIIVRYTYNAGSTCGWTKTDRIPYEIEYCPHDTWEGLFHEFGHGFGLGDTYHIGGRGGNCIAGQPDSVMCNNIYKDLQPDDIKGIKALFCRYNASLCNGSSNPSGGTTPSGGDTNPTGTKVSGCTVTIATSWDRTGDPRANLRPGPSKDSGSSGTVNEGENYPLVAENPSGQNYSFKGKTTSLWYQIDVNGASLWLWSAYGRKTCN